MIRKLATLCCVAIMAFCHADRTYALTPRDAFLDAPSKIIPLLNHNTRLDMLDYFNSGMATSSTNIMQGQSRIVSSDDASMKVKLTEASEIDIAIIPAAAGDTLVALISTVATPAPDSKLSVYSADWTRDVTPAVFTRPLLKDWLTADGRKNTGDVESLVPFLLISYVYEPASGTLTLTNNTEQFMSPDVYSIVEAYLLPKLVYKWDGRKFARQK
ncbi:MAG: DUF3256 family protein [Muribaculaceae bacterium]|nr:DUF3256 family protein [Muribaculaceae bacterium]